MNVFQLPEQIPDFDPIHDCESVILEQITYSELILEQIPNSAYNLPD